MLKRLIPLLILVACAGFAAAQDRTSQVDRTDRGDVQEVNQLRQELVLTVGRHDGELAYQLLRSTQMPNANQPNNMVVTAGNNRRVFLDQGDNLEQRLLATVSANDP